MCPQHPGPLRRHPISTSCLSLAHPWPAPLTTCLCCTAPVLAPEGVAPQQVSNYDAGHVSSTHNRALEYVARQWALDKLCLESLKHRYPSETLQDVAKRWVPFMTRSGSTDINRNSMLDRAYMQELGTTSTAQQSTSTSWPRRESMRIATCTLTVHSAALCSRWLFGLRPDGSDQW